MSGSHPSNDSIASSPSCSDTKQATWQLLGIWLAVRLITSAWAALVSPLHPLTSREQVIALWPPSAPLGAWLERVLLAPWERWDTGYYIWIVARGYRADDGTAQFHPLFPWLATPINWLVHQPLLSLLIVSSLASVLLLLVFERLARLDLNADAARASTLLLAFSPLAFVLFAPYSEALFLLCAALCLLGARQRSWWLAGIAGGLAALTRQQGIFLLLPVAWEMWESTGRNARRLLAAWHSRLPLGLIPLGLLVWLIYRAVALNDLAANLDNLHTLVYSLLISPSANKVVPVQTFMWPWQALWLALQKLWYAPEQDLIIDLIFGGGFVVLMIFAWRGMRTSYRLYTLAITLVSFGYHTGPRLPYLGLPRHLLLAFPIFIGLAPVIRRPWLRLLMTAGGLFGMLFLLLMYVIEGWVP